jgi:hypothetical protein
MPPVIITLDDVRQAIRKTQNWKAPGADGIHNFWLKYFKCTHEVLANLFQETLEDPSLLPRFLTVGVIYMWPKSGSALDPKNYRPITCLPTLYKVLTSVISSKLYAHLTENEILAPEQAGCRKGSRECKELLIVDSVVSQQAKKEQRDISVGWVDYKKAFGSVPHSWLLRILELYKIDPKVIQLLITCMTSWRTTLHGRTESSSYKIDELPIRNGIFQGDSLSPLWFYLALNPLSRMLRTSGYGYIVKRRPNVIISHQFYMDDLKLYARSPDQLQSMFALVKISATLFAWSLVSTNVQCFMLKRGKFKTQKMVLSLWAILLSKT